MRRVVILALLATCFGCGTDVANEAADPDSGTPLSGEWELLLDGEWSLIGGSEQYLCVVATVPEDMFVGAFRPIAPEGTHHTVLTRIDNRDDGDYPCGATSNGHNQIYGSGVGTQAFHYPPGVAVKLEAGEQLLLNLHLFNTRPSELSGISGVEVIRIAESGVMNEAETTLAGTLSFELPPQSTSTVEGSCVLPDDKTLFAVWPHMHQLGTHMTVTVLHGGGETVVHDAPYSFEDQRAFPLDPIAVARGDAVHVACSYNNTTDATVGFGDSSLAEMCFAGLTLYPATGIRYLCGF
jgi:hypothetical protein